MVKFFLLVLLSAAQGADIKVKIVQPDGLKYVQIGENISLNCTFSSHMASSIFWLRQPLGEKPHVITSVYYNTDIKYDTDLEKTGRFTAVKTKNSFFLNISKAELSDSATYYCAVTYSWDIDLDSCTVAVLKGSPANHYTYIHQPALNPVILGDNITLQCSVLTKGCAGEHSVYWFRHGSGESHPGIIYTHGGSSDQCNKSSDTDSSTWSCVYNLPKNNLKTSDAGTYYCAVDMCGQILFSNGTNPDSKEHSVLEPALVVLGASNILLLAVVLFTCMKLHKSYKKDVTKEDTTHINQNEDADALNYAALSFDQPLASRRTRAKISSEQSVYAQVMIQK